MIKAQRYIAWISAALLVYCCLGNTAWAETSEPSIHYRDLPTGLQSRIVESLSALAKVCPVSEDVKASIAATVHSMSSNAGPQNRQCAEKIKIQGYGAVNVLVDSLQSQDDMVRKNSLWCMAMFESKIQEDTKADASIDQTLVLLYRRSLMDRSIEIRRLAAMRLFALSKRGKADTQDDAELALKEAVSSDPDAGVRNLAERLLTTLEAISRRSNQSK